MPNLSRPSPRTHRWWSATPSPDLSPHHGSARNQAFQADAARHSAVAPDDLPKIPAKEVSVSTWVWGTSETLLVAGLMIAGYLLSGRLARRPSRGCGRPPGHAGGPVSSVPW